MVMMMSNSSSIAATKSITVRLSNSRSPANEVSSSISTPFLLNGSTMARIRVSTSARSMRDVSSCYAARGSAATAMRPKSGWRARLSSREGAGKSAGEGSREREWGMESSPGSEAPAPASYSYNAIHLVRTTQQQTLLLSQMADQKASILMGASF